MIEATATRSGRGLSWALGLLVVVGTLTVFAPMRGHDFVSYDDVIYIVENPNLRSGPSLESIKRAFSEPYEANWIPLTWISLQVDHAIHGVDPAGYHTTNLLLHTASAAVLFLALLALTGAPGASAFCAAVFAVHPLHVESVAWASERKDTLSGLFWMLTLLAYARYARRRTFARYSAVLAALCAGLLAKPSVVVLPLCLSLLDVWPLARVGPNAARSRDPLRWIEKIPMWLAAAAVAFVTILVQSERGAMEHGDALPFGLRIANAVDATGWYLGKAIWPTNLGVFYPHPLEIPSPGLTWLTGLGLAAATVAAVLAVRRAPWVTAGWLWFGVVLAPVLGLLQAGMQSHADRYTYLALIGPSWIVAFGGAALVSRWPRLRTPIFAVAGLVVLAFSVVSRDQLRHWQGSEQLWERAIAVSEDNFVAHRGLAEFHLERGDLEQGDLTAAEKHAREAVRIKPRWPEARVTWGDVLATRERHAEAIAQYEQALAQDPEHPRAHSNLGIALVDSGRADEAIAHFDAALAAQRDIGFAHLEALRAQALAHAGDLPAAIRGYERALALDPGFAEAHANLGFALLGAGRVDAADLALRTSQGLGLETREAEAALARIASMRGQPSAAIAHYRKALAIDPSWSLAANNLAWLLATDPAAGEASGREAMDLVGDAMRDGGATPDLLDTLGAALARAGRFDEARRTGLEAARLARARGDDALAVAIDARARRYAEGLPFDDTGADRDER